MLAPVDRSPPRILYVASGPAPLALEVLGLVERRFPEHQVDLVISPPCLDQLSSCQRTRVAFVVGSGGGRAAFLLQARRTPYWLVVLLLSGDGGFLTMKLAALLLGLGRVVVCYNEHADAFALDRHHGSAMVTYLRRRVGLRGAFGRGLGRAILRAPYMALGEPIGLVWMTTSIVGWRIQAWLGRRGRP